MAAAGGVIAGVSAVSSIASKNSSKRQQREAAQAQAYYANKKYETTVMNLNAQKQLQEQSDLITELSLKSTRLQEDYALAEADIQNLAQAANYTFQNQQRKLQADVQTVQQLAEADKAEFQAGQQKRSLDAQASQSSQEGLSSVNTQLDEIMSAIAKGDTEQASMLALMAAQGQSSDSVTSSIMSSNIDAEQAVASAKAALEAGRFTEEDLISLTLSDTFSSALERLGILQADATRTAATGNQNYNNILTQATQYNIDSERDLTSKSNAASRQLLSNERSIQDSVLDMNSLYNDYSYQSNLSSAEIERGAGITSANQQYNNASGAGLFDYLNAGYSVYRGASGLFNSNSSSNSNSGLSFGSMSYSPFSYNDSRSNNSTDLGIYNGIYNGVTIPSTSNITSLRGIK